MAPPRRPQANAALAEILARDEAAGIDIFGTGPRPAPGPAAHVEPLRRPGFPAPDWRQEEAAARARDAEPIVEAGPPPPQSLQATPARPQRKAQTPNLDRVKAELGKLR